MKKILIYLQSLVISTTPILTTISCNKTKENSINDKLNNGLPEQEKEIIKNTALFTKMLLLSRHENLNFNSTEVLSAIFAPKTTWYSFPRTYTVDGKTYNLIDYTEKLTTKYSNLGKLNSADFNPFYASTLTGMYEDELYQNYVAQEKIKKYDIFGYFNQDEDFNQNELTPVVKLAKDKDRQQLAWANFTGPLSKYIAYNKLFSNYKDINLSGKDLRKFYGRFLDMVINHKDSGLEMKEDWINLKNENKAFGKYQIQLTNLQDAANFSSKILDFLPFIQNFNETASGSIYGLKLLNNLFPFTDTKSNMDTTYISFLLLQNSIEWMKSFSKKYSNDEKATAIAKQATIISNTNKSNALGLFQKIGINFLSEAIKPTIDGFKVQMLMKKVQDSTIDLFTAIKEFKNLTSNWAKNWDKVMKDAFLTHIKSQIESLKNITKFVNESASNFIQEGLNSLKSAEEVIDLYNALGDMIGIIADNQDKFLEIDKKDSPYKEKDLDSLTIKQQKIIASLMGFKNTKFEEGSVLSGLYKLINNKTFKKLILDQNSPIYKYNNANAKEIHKNLLQYALDDQYWTIDPKSFKMDGSIEGKNSIAKKFSYSLEYKGIGDKTVTKFLNKPVELPEDFNPLEPWRKPLANDVSKDWTLEDHIAYTGLGNGGEDYGKVNFKYNVEWSNVSVKPDFPYLVITKIDCFRKENGTWKQFCPVM